MSYLRNLTFVYDCFTFDESTPTTGATVFRDLKRKKLFRWRCQRGKFKILEIPALKYSSPELRVLDSSTRDGPTP
jgi:hypothetical protein